MSLLIAIQATLPFPAEYRDDVKAVMKFMFTEDFDHADSVAKQVKSELPDSPLGGILRLASLEFYMTDWSTDERVDEFMSEYDAANEMCRKAIDETEGAEKAKWHMFRGAVVGFKAVHYARRYQEKTNVLRALKYAKEALDEFGRAYDLDSTLYDCYLAMGLYDLAISYMQKKIPWLSSENRKKSGMAKLSIAMEKSDLFKPLAMMAYVYVYMYEDNPDLALQYLGFLKTMYPNSRTLAWLELDVYLENERWYYGQQTAENLLATLEKKQPNCYVNQAEAHIAIARCWYHLGDADDAREHLDLAKALLDKQTDENHAGAVKKIRSKLSDAEKEMK